MGKIAVYTCITGGYDKPKTPMFAAPDMDFFLFTDDKNLKESDVKPYEIRHVDIWEDDKKRTARRVKLSPHLLFPDYEYSVWLDGSMTVVGDFRELIAAKMKDFDVLFAKHRHRKNALQEAKTCAMLKADKPETIKHQMGMYQQWGCPLEKIPLIESGMQIRRHNKEKVKNFYDIWRHEVETRSNRDQISFGYASWKAGLNFAIMDHMNSYEFREYFDNNWRHGQ